VSRAYLLPGCARSPTVFLSRRELERTVLDEFCIETTISTVVDVLKEDTD
jgi:hypothetical protein